LTPPRCMTTHTVSTRAHASIVALSPAWRVGSDQWRPDRMARMSRADESFGQHRHLRPFAPDGHVGAAPSLVLSSQRMRRCARITTPRPALTAGARHRPQGQRCMSPPRRAG
jgi:hypothetical protein